MRRTGLIFTGLLLMVIVVARPAGAHPSLEPPVGTVGQRSGFAITIDSHFPGSELTGFEITAPADFQLDEVKDPPGGWTREDTATSVRFRGHLTPGRVVRVDVTGTPLRKGVLVFSITTTSAAGEAIRWIAACTDVGAPYKGAHLFVGVDPATACDPPAERSAIRMLGLGLIAAALVLGAAYPIVRRSRQSDA